MQTIMNERRHPATRMLVLATVGFGLNFWAWALLSPLAAGLRDTLRLSAFQQSLVVATPVIVGALGRVPMGALTDRHGGRIMFPLASLATVAPVLYLGLSGHNSLPGLLIGGFFLGIGGASFAIGVPLVNAWHPPARRGFAIGVFGMGMGGSAISALTTVRLAGAYGFAAPFALAAIALTAYAIVAALLVRDATPGAASGGPPPRPAESLPRQLAATARLRVTWQASALYAVVFGGYVAFSVYLPTYLKNAYHLTQTDAANRMAGFVLLAVLARPAGGWLSDRFAPARVLSVTLLVAAVAAAAQAVTPGLAPVGTSMFLSMAAAFGVGSGATFALVARLAPSSKVGSVTGVVGAAGGLGGFVPPLVMGLLYGEFGSYGVGLALLAMVALASLPLAAASRSAAGDRGASASVSKGSKARE